MTNVIDQFMWQWQPHFRIRLQVLADMSLRRIGAQLDPEVILVGLTDSAGGAVPDLHRARDGQS